MTAPTGCPVAHGRAPEPVAAADAHAEAEEFLRLFHGEHPNAGPVEPRLAQVLAEIDETGTYRHTEGELAFGARVAWRNSARCIGRLYWQSLRVRDMRKVRDASAVAAQCAEHLRSATNGGRIRPTVTVFAPETPQQPAPRIWNEQLIRYAGYWDAETGRSYPSVSRQAMIMRLSSPAVSETPTLDCDSKYLGKTPLNVSWN